jgi:3-oxoacyl-[acyl-carrier protein] reductase
MPTAYLSLGSNLGDRRGSLDAAVRRLRAEPGVRVTAVSGYYETVPVGAGYQGQAPFLNAAVSVETDLPPLALLRLILDIEHHHGRTRQQPNSPRTLDLDLLLYADRVWDEPQLTLPHPRMHERAFVLVPLADIADDAVHPVLRRTVHELLEGVDRSGVTLAVPPQPVRRRDLLTQRVLVTGSTGGIGRAIAEAFADQGADVVVHGRDAKGADATALRVKQFGSRAEVRLADLANPAAVDQLAADAWTAFGGDGLDILVCNAGADTLTGDGAKRSFDEKLEALVNVDIKATIRLARGVGQRMKTRGHGVILTVGWDQAETGMEGDSGELFAAVKGAIHCFTRSLSLSLAPEVRVNCVAPGWVRTSWGETAPAVWQDRVKRETPQRVWGLPADVAAAAVWLAGPTAGFVTGQTVRVNGGAVR